MHQIKCCFRLSWVWDAFLTLPQKFQCDLGAYASRSHICRNGLMSFFTASFVGSARAWKHGPQTGAERRCICINANCAGLRFKCSTLICMQTHRKTTRANVVHLARWERGRSGVTAVAQRLCLLQSARGHGQRPHTQHGGSSAVLSEAGCFSSL